jgi:hypothetical protein
MNTRRIFITVALVGGARRSRLQRRHPNLHGHRSAERSHRRGEAAGDLADNAAEALVRNIATQQGEEQFTNAGYALDGPLTCTATVTDGADSIEIACTGTTQDGGAASLAGATDELPGASVVSLSGSFVGTVDGQEVFTTSQLGG